jgi:hypothetical protein
MSAIVGIDASVLIAEVGASQFAGGTGGNPEADELPTWNPTTKLWSWSNPDTLTDPDDVTPWMELPERNEISLSISVDVAEHRPFVASLEDAWVGKARTWMDWSGSFSGFYDDADDSIFNTMKSGLAVWMIMFDSRFVEALGTPADYWFGKILLTSVDHTTGSEDFSTLDVDFEGAGKLYRSAVA